MSSRDPKVWMWAEACEVLERAERIHRQYFQLGKAERRPTWQPPADIYETETLLVVQVALPGVASDRLTVTFQGSGLVVSGERLLPAETRHAHVHRLEIPHGLFERYVDLPPGRYTLESRDYIDGCLTLRLRKLP